MSEPMKIRARMVDGSAHIIVLMIHPMETGQRKDPRSGQVFPAHFIQRVTATVNDKPVLNVAMRPGDLEEPGVRLPRQGRQVRRQAGDRLGRQQGREGPFRGDDRLTLYPSKLNS